MCVAAAHRRGALNRANQAVANALRSASAIARGVVLAGVLILAMLGPGPARVAGATSASAVLTKIDPDLVLQMTANPLRLLPVIVEMEPAAAPFPVDPNQQRAVRALTLLTQFGRPIGALALISSAAGFANATGISAISLDPQVAFIHLDSTVRAESVAGSPVPLSAAYPRAVKADQVWPQGPTGAGITVAVLDSGINADLDLTQPQNRLLAAANFAGNRGGLADAGGHGTHVAGIVAGNGQRSAGEYVGIAPGANVLDVRVLDRNGNGRISSVIRGIEWVLAHRDQYNIRFINLSLGMPARLPYQSDPLCAAVEIAWERGVVVLAAAGNRGPAAGSVDSPGIDPYVITVGATDDRATNTVDDDILNSFSSWGTPAGSSPKPDVVAPGRRIVSLRSPGSYLDTQYPDRVTTAQNGATYFRLTGTSMATPVVAGSAALLLQHQTGLTPNQVKAILVGKTRPWGSATGGGSLPNPSADGSGLVDALASVYSPPLPPANQAQRPANTLARALYPILYGQPLTWKDLHYLGIDWSQLTWTNLAWDNLAWDNLAWDNLAWDNLAWDNLAWDNLAWDNLAWDNLAWDNLAWDSGHLD
jgi:serine protease AprX